MAVVVGTQCSTADATLARGPPTRRRRCPPSLPKRYAAPAPDPQRCSLPLTTWPRLSSLSSSRVLPGHSADPIPSGFEPNLRPSARSSPYIYSPLSPRPIFFGKFELSRALELAAGSRRSSPPSDAFRRSYPSRQEPPSRVLRPRPDEHRCRDSSHHLPSSPLATDAVVDVFETAEKLRVSYSTIRSSETTGAGATIAARGAGAVFFKSGDNPSSVLRIFR
nr:uncharacterized protein LOC120964734 [Aegilops tauschii subsp. strangulata]